MHILGIDPGLRLTGYGCIDALGENASLVEAGVFRLGRAEPGADARSVSSRLAELDTDLRAVLTRLKPDLVAVESLFAHYKHPATAIVMGHARGVVLLAIAQADIRLVEFKPNEVKKSLTGHGHADKARMQRAIQARFSLPRPPSPPDVADAIAIALCAAGRRGSLLARVEVAVQLEGGRGALRRRGRISSNELRRAAGGPP